MEWHAFTDSHLIYFGGKICEGIGIFYGGGITYEFK